MIYWALAKKWNDEQKKFDYRVEIGVTEEALNILGNQNGWVTGLPDYANVSDLAEYQAHWIFDNMYSTWVEEEGMTEEDAWTKALEICGVWE